MGQKVRNKTFERQLPCRPSN